MPRSDDLAAGLAVAATAILFSTLPATAADYPSRPVTIIVPYGAGGGVSINTMTLAPYLEKALGQKVLVEHRAGAGGVTGSTLGRVRKAGRLHADDGEFRHRLCAVADPGG